MAGRTPLTNVDPVTAVDASRRRYDPYKVDQAAELMLTYMYRLLPSFPVYDGRRLTALDAPGGIDLISRISRALLRDIVSRLPVKDAVRTTVLSSRWRTIWLTTPLVLSDSHLIPDGRGWPPTPDSSRAITAAVSRILEAHPRPFRCVRLACSHMNKYRDQLARWLQLLAAKGVQDLVLVNRPWPCEVPLPDKLFSITALTRLYVGFWKLPSTAVLLSASFPHLRELGICSIAMEHGDVESLIAGCPVLEVLNIQGCMKGLRLRLISQSLRCVQVCLSIMEKITLLKTPRLERLILYGSCPRSGSLCTRVRIVAAPNLHTFGYLEPGYVLEIRDTMIMPGIKPSASNIVASVKILSLNVRFGVRNDVKMVPTFLKCFPNAERLHIRSEKCDEPTGNLTLKFWKRCGSIENVVSRINMMSLREFRGEPGEVGFLEFFFESAGVLKTATIVMANPSFTPFSKDEALSKVRRSSRNMASKSCEMFVLGSNGPDGGDAWNFKTGSKFSFEDPFSVALQFLWRHGLFSFGCRTMKHGRYPVHVCWFCRILGMILGGSQR